MTVTRWYIGDSDPVVAEGELSNYPNTTIGEEVTFEFYIRESEIDDYGTAAYGDVYGTVYSDELTYQTAEERYNRLKEYLRYAGYANVSRTIGSAYFTEPFDLTNATVDSLLVPIYPHTDIQEARGVWGVITGGSDSTEVFGALARVDLTVFVLAEYDDYDSETAVRNEFETSI